MDALTRFRLLSGIIVAGSFLAVRAAEAGPPLICHDIEIGEAKSLPWRSGLDSDKAYDRQRLTADTLKLLTAETPVIVRMETLRRAAIYASEKPALRSELLSALQTRILNAEARKEPDALAWFDAGYLSACCEQLDHSSKHAAEAPTSLTWMKKAASLRPDDAQIDFALALTTSMCKQETGGWHEHPDHKQYLRKAIAGAKGGDLIARNLVLRFSRDGKGSLDQLRKQYARG